MDETYLAKVKNSEPEQFLFVTWDPTQGSMKNTTAPVSEGEIREFLSSNGMPQQEIDSKVAHARQNPI